MGELTTKEVLEAAGARGAPMSQKLLTDLARRGLVGPPARRQRRVGGPGSESWWPDGTLERLQQINELRGEGLSYDDIGARLGSETPPKVRRLSATLWLPTDRAEALAAVCKKTRTPVLTLLQQGARLYHEAPLPVQEALRTVEEFQHAVADPDTPTDSTFNVWASILTAYHEVLSQLQVGQLPMPRDPLLDGYLLWRVLNDGWLTPKALRALRIAQEPVEQDGEVVGTLTVFSGRLKLLRPLPSIAGDSDRCWALAKELGAVLVTADGRDFSAAGAAKSLAAVGDWLRERNENGR